MHRRITALFALCPQVTGEINFSSADLQAGDHPLIRISGLDEKGRVFSFYAEYDALAECLGKLVMPFMMMRADLEMGAEEGIEVPQGDSIPSAADDLPY